MTTVSLTPESSQGCTVLIEFSPEEEARQYAQQAQASATAAAASATQAGNSATAAQASANAAAASASEAAANAAAAAASEAAAAANAAAAAASEAAAAASEAAAAVSATAAATSASEAAVSATAAATSASEAAASEAAAATSASQAAASATAAATSASQAAASEAAAATSASEAAASETNAAASATDAEAAKNTVEGILDFTAGNLYRGDGAGIAAINEADLFKNLAVISKSALGAMIDSDNVFAWDNFSRPNTASTTTTDSGHAYVQIAGSSGLRIENNYAYKNARADFIGVNTGFGSVRLVANIRIRPQTSWISVGAGKDADNWVRFGLNNIGASGIQLDVRVAGVQTTVESKSYATVFGNAIKNSSVVTIIFDLVMPAEGTNSLYCRVNCPQLPGLTFLTDLSSYRTSLFPTEADLAFAGFLFGCDSKETKISSFYIQKID